MSVLSALPPHRQLNHILQVVPMCPPIWAHWCHLANTVELVLPSTLESTTQMANRSVQLFLHSSWQSVVECIGATTEIVHNGFIWRIWLNWCFLRPTRVHNPDGKSIGSTISTQLTAECPYTLQWHTPPSSKLPLPIGGSGPHLTHGSLGPPESSTQMASRSVQPFLQGSLVWQTDRPTDHTTQSVSIHCIHIHSTSDAV